MKKCSLSMMVVWLLSASAWAETTLPVGAAESSKTCSMAVLDLVPLGLPEGEKHVAQVLTATLAGELSRVSKCRVLTSEEIRAVVNYESEKQMCGSEDASCLAELGSAMGVERIVSGTVSKIGTVYTLQVRIVNIESVVVEQRTERSSEDINALAPLTKSSVPALLGQKKDEAVVESGGGRGLLWAGVGLGSVGALVTTGGVVGQLLSNAVLGDPKSSSDDKEGAITNSKIAVAATVVGALLLVSGVGLAILGAGE